MSDNNLRVGIRWKLGRRFYCIFLVKLNSCSLFHLDLLNNFSSYFFIVYNFVNHTSSYIIYRLPGISEETHKMVSDDVIEKHLIWAATTTARISNVDDLFGVNYWFLWTLPSQSILQSLQPISKTLTLQKILEDTTSALSTVSEEDFTEDNLTTVLKAFAKEKELKFPRYMSLLRGVLSGHKVSTVFCLF